MKPLTLSSILFIMMLSSCNIFYQTGNTADDAYYSRKKTKQAEKTQMIPDVNVDSIIRQNPPQYGSPPLNKTDDDANINPYAAILYPAYKAKQDSLYELYPWLSGYYTSTTPPPFDEREAAKQAKQLQREMDYEYGYGNSWLNNSSFNLGFGYNPYYGFAPTFGMGWNYGYNNFYSPYFYNSFYPYNYWGWGYNSWYYPYHGWNNWGWGYPYYNGNDNKGNTNPPSRQQPRPNVGGTTPGGVTNPNQRTRPNITTPAPNNKQQMQPGNFQKSTPSPSVPRSAPSAPRGGNSGGGGGTQRPR